MTPAQVNCIGAIEQLQKSAAEYQKERCRQTQRTGGAFVASIRKKLYGHGYSVTPVKFLFHTHHRMALKGHQMPKVLVQVTTQNGRSRPMAPMKMIMTGVIIP